MCVCVCVCIYMYTHINTEKSLNVCKYQIYTADAELMQAFFSGTFK